MAGAWDVLLRRIRSHPRIATAVAVAVVGMAVVWTRPRAAFLDPARPDLGPDLMEPPVIPASQIAAPVRIPLAPLVALLEEAVPTTYGDMEARHALEGHDRTDVAFQLWREPFRVAVNGPVATVRTTLQYAMRAYYDPPVLPEMSGSCGTGDPEDRPRLEVVISAPVTVDRAWTLTTRARVADVRPATDESKDKCRVTFLDLDVTGSVVNAARSFLTEHMPTLDSLAQQVDVRAHVRGWWGTLEEPLPLGDSLWLVMQPEAVRRGPVVGYGDSLEIGLALRARPSVAYGARPDFQRRALPPLESGPVDEGLDLRVEAHAGYDAASAFLTDQLEGRTFRYQDRSVRLDSARVFGIGGGRLALELLVSGDVAARLYLVGTPRIDAATGRVSMPDLDFDVATRNVVLAAVSWFRSSDLRDLLRERASWPAQPAVALLAEWIDRGLNQELSDDLRLEGEVGSVDILGVHALRNTLLVRLAVGGSARLVVQDD